MAPFRDRKGVCNWAISINEWLVVVSCCGLIVLHIYFVWQIGAYIDDSVEKHQLATTLGSSVDLLKVSNVEKTEVFDTIFRYRYDTDTFQVWKVDTDTILILYKSEVSISILILILSSSEIWYRYWYSFKKDWYQLWYQFFARNSHFFYQKQWK